MLATLLVAAAALPAAVSAQTDESTLSVSVNQGPQGSVFVTVTSNGTAVENATVVVDAENETYDGEGTYTTDADGMVAMDVPEHDVTATVTATAENKTGSTIVELQAPSLNLDVEQDDDAEATVTVTYSITGERVDGADVNVSPVDDNASYVGTGDYTSDENGTIELPAPDETVEVAIEAAAENLSGSLTVELENASTAEGNESAFGQRVSAFVHSLVNGDSQDRRIGLIIAQWVTANNPGNAPDHAGPPEDVGPDGDDEGEEDAEDDDDRERGPPDHAADENERDDEADEDGEEAGDDDDDDDRRGPPEHAGSNGAGNGR